MMGESFLVRATMVVAPDGAASIGTALVAAIAAASPSMTASILFPMVVLINRQAATTTV